MTALSQPLGPFDTYAQATDAAAVLHVELDLLRLSGRTPNQVRMMQRGARRRYITKHLRAAHVELGQYDKAIVMWVASVADESPEVLVTILGWVLRSKGVKR
ncbi:hypothetical protein KDL01_04245 [Actinospica durhamensis]|uniref:Uncharacterized protein n=1 Tax=Actinospica durhamensis TaxID=1508375 RepID=A0A941IQ05_9ACTN|nr:hypothetical protein [Actinospica durhamensis]MBR7832453.1 hypothetical protein [Actinospica durhamensis]